MREQIQTSSEADRLPSGYISVEQLSEPSILPEGVLPWADGEVELATAKCTIMGGKSFYLASAVGTHDSLIKAASEMTEQQNKNCNNMFYSRIAGFIENDLRSPGVEKFNGLDTIDAFSLKNEGGQRVYFGVYKSPNTSEPLIIRLAACDKNRQKYVLNTISNYSTGTQRRLNRKATR